MNIAVWCASSNGTDPAYMNCAREAGTWIANNGHTLVYGGSNPGLMGAVSNACLEAGGEIIGVSVRVEKILAQRNANVTRGLIADTLSERKATMIELADAYLVLPGGLGTFDELGDALALARSGAEHKRIAIYNVNGFYDVLKPFFENIVDAGFAAREDFANLLITSNFEELTAFLES